MSESKPEGESGPTTPETKETQLSEEELEAAAGGRGVITLAGATTNKIVVQNGNDSLREAETKVLLSATEINGNSLSVKP